MVFAAPALRHIVPWQGLGLLGKALNPLNTSSVLCPAASPDTCVSLHFCLCKASRFPQEAGHTHTIKVPLGNQPRDSHSWHWGAFGNTLELSLSSSEWHPLWWLILWVSAIGSNYWDSSTKVVGEGREQNRHSTVWVNSSLSTGSGHRETGSLSLCKYDKEQQCHMWVDIIRWESQCKVILIQSSKLVLQIISLKFLFCKPRSLTVKYPFPLVC